MHFQLKLRKTKLLRIVLIVLLFNLAGIYFMVNDNIFINSPLNNNNYNLINLPETSDNEITIKTPENKTYVAPMSGYYPALHGFENNDDGSDPVGFNVHEGAGYVNVIGAKNGHTKVVEMYDGINSDHTELHNVFQPQTSGTIEFWMLDEDATDTFSIILLDDTATSVWGDEIGWIQIWQDNLRYLDDVDWHDTSKAISDNTWYHLKIEFECTSGNYQGLAQRTWRFYVDGESFGDYTFRNNLNNVSQIYFATRGADMAYKCFVDAIGYSWNSSYTTGDNLNEGLLLGFEKSISLDWIGFSLDGSSNKTIVSNTTIPLPPIGPHNIQVYGNDSLSTTHASNKMYFTISANQNITINTPENKTYTEAMNGYYPATYGFENDEDGTIPVEWTFESSSGLCSISVYDLKENHKKVIFVTDADTGIGIGADSTAQHIFKTTHIAGTIEFWVYKESGTTPIYIQCNDGATSAFAVRIDYINNGKFEFNSGGSWVEFANGKYSDQTWFHLKIQFDCVADLTDIYLNGIIEVDDRSFIQPVTDISFIQIRSAYSGESGSLFFDAVGFSWDSNYNIGDNLKEGLLLSYENSTNLDWIGYSLDGSPNITITGNTVIPFPEFGIHSIIINGITSNGVSLKSELRYFTIFINIQDPLIPPDNPNLIPMILSSIGIAIIVLLGIALILYRRKISSRTSYTIISHRKPQSDEDITSGSDQIKACPLCHTPIEKTALFCVYCGVSLKND